MRGPTPAAITWPSSRVDEILEALSTALDGRGPAVIVIPADAPGRILAAVRPDEPLERADIAAIVPTSGSSGAPKGVLLTGDALTASARLTHGRLGGAGQWLLALPPTHIAGLQVLVRSLVAGRPPVVLDATGGFDVERFAAASARLDGPRRYTALVPTQLGRIVDRGGAALDALRSFDAVLVGGGPLAAHLEERARGAGVRVVTTYGMTETAGGCVYDGVPLDGVEVDVAADGVIRVAGPTLAVGYRLDPRASAAAFRDGWFVTADRGRLSADGRLVVLGRADDAILTGGVTVDPAEVEATLAAHPKVQHVAVFGVPSETWGEEVATAVVPTDPADPPTLDELRSFARPVLDGPRLPRRLHVVEALPRLPGEKIDRQALRHLIAE